MLAKTVLWTLISGSFHFAIYSRLSVPGALFGGPIHPSLTGLPRPGTLSNCSCPAWPG